MPPRGLPRAAHVLPAFAAKRNGRSGSPQEFVRRGFVKEDRNAG